MISYRDTSDAVLCTIRELLARGERVTPRGVPTVELRDYGFSVREPSSGPIVSRDVEHNECMARYYEAEMRLYLAGERRASEYAKYGKMWAKITNPDGTINSAYGWLIFYRASCGHERFEGVMRTPWQWAMQCLLADPDTRQAYVRVSMPDHQWMGNLDQTCTMHLNFSIRQKRLHLCGVMRSNDVTRGLVYDLPFFCFLLRTMRNELLPKYPWLEMGQYTHFAHSMHLYDSEREKALRMLGDR